MSNTLPLVVIGDTAEVKKNSVFQFTPSNDAYCVDLNFFRLSSPPP